MNKKDKDVGPKSSEKSAKICGSSLKRKAGKKVKKRKKTTVRRHSRSKGKNNEKNILEPRKQRGRDHQGQKG